jgi:hypothetical protein
VWATYALLAANVALFLLQQHLNVLAVFTMTGPPHAVAVPNEIVSPADMLRLPYPTVAHDLHPSEKIHIGLLACAVAQAFVLWGLWRTLPGTLALAGVRIALAVAVGIMFGAALFVPALSSMDTYAYAGYAKLGMANAYAPPARVFHGTFGAIEHLWGRPIVACVYGPLWVFFNQFIAGSARTLGQAVFVERLIGIAGYGTLLLALRILNVSPATSAIVAINPMLVNQFVANGHNDIIGVTFVLFALAAVAELPLLAAVLVACGSLVKITMLALGLVVFAGRGRLARRTGYVALAVVLTLGASVEFGGPAYMHTLLHQGLSVNHATQLTSSIVMTRVLAACAVAILALGFMRGDVLRAGAWPLCALTGLIYPWYLIWGLPYAIRAKAAAAHYLILLPIVAAALQTDFIDQHAHQYVLAAIIALLTASAFLAFVPHGKRLLSAQRT